MVLLRIKALPVVFYLQLYMREKYTTHDKIIPYPNVHPNNLGNKHTRSLAIKPFLRVRLPAEAGVAAAADSGGLIQV